MCHLDFSIYYINEILIFLFFELQRAIHISFLFLEKHFFHLIFHCTFLLLLYLFWASFVLSLNEASCLLNDSVGSGGCVSQISPQKLFKTKASPPPQICFNFLLGNHSFSFICHVQVACVVHSSGFSVYLSCHY